MELLMLGSSRNVCGIKWGTNTITSYILKGILSEQLLAADAGLGRKIGGGSRVADRGQEDGHV